MAHGYASHVVAAFWYLGLEDANDSVFSLPDNQSLDGTSSHSLSDNQLPNEISFKNLQNDQLPNQIASYGIHNGTNFHNLDKEDGVAPQYCKSVDRLLMSRLPSEILLFATS
jgi:hypothetical protein